MIANRELTDEEKEKHRRWQMEEILRRRGRTGHPFVEPGSETRPELKLDAIEYKCQRCGKPYANPKRRRCYVCSPGSSFRPDRSPPARPKPPPRRIGLDEAFARPKGPVYVPETETAVVVTPEPEPEVGPPPGGEMIHGDKDALIWQDHPDRLRSAPESEPVVQDHLRVDPIDPDPIAALRRVVEALDGLDDATVRWVLRSAARLLRRPGGDGE